MKKFLFKILVFPLFIVLFFLTSCELMETIPPEGGTVIDKKSDYVDDNSDDDIDDKSDEIIDGDHEHEFHEVVAAEFLLQEATCESAAIYVYSCSCGVIDYDQFFEYGSPLGHDYIENPSDNFLCTFATCNNKANYYYSCSRCNRIDETRTFEYGDYATHVFSAQNASDETLAEHANCYSSAKYYYSCINCNAIDYSNTFEYGDYDYENHHHIVESQIKEATCTSGSLMQIYCEDCGKIINEYVNDDRTSHDFIAVEKDIYLCSSATCTSPATYYYSCSVCGTLDTNTFYSNLTLDHYYTQNISTKYLVSEATCTSPATYYYSCLNCGKKSDETFTRGLELRHSIKQIVSDETLAQVATCSTQARYYYTCNRCNEILKDIDTFASGDTLPHNYSLENATNETLCNEATCTKKATYYYSCSNCNNIEYKSSHTFESGDFKEHNFIKSLDSLSFEKQDATCLTPAIYYYSCKDCKQIDYDHTFETGSPRGHNYYLADYHYKENLNDDNYLIKTCADCNDVIHDELIVEEDSNIYNFEYNITGNYNSKICTITGYKTFYGDDRDINITLPTTYKGIPVTFINYDALLNATNLNSITILQDIDVTSSSIIYAPLSLKLVTSSIIPPKFYNSDTNFEVEYHVIGKGLYGTYLNYSSLTDKKIYFDFVEEKENDNFEYILCNDGTSDFITIKKYKGNDEEVVIPDTIDGYPVKRIANYAFADNSSIKMIITPESLLETDYHAINNCSSLKFIYSKALNPSSNWKYRAGYRQVIQFGYISKGIYTKNDDDLFNYIIYNDGTKVSAMITEVLFFVSWDPNVIKVTSYSVLKDITKIGDYDLTAIGDYAFSFNFADVSSYKNFTNLYVDLYIPTSIEVIKSYAFDDCTWLTSINLTSNLKELGRGAFSNCNKLTSVGDTSSLTKIEDETFNLCKKLKEFNYTSKLTSIGQKAFHMCESLTSFTLPEGLTEIGSYAFSGCSITSIVLPSTLNDIGIFAFSENHNLSSFTFAENSSLTYIPETCFYRNYALTKISIPDYILSIGESAFSECTSLTNINIPKNVNYIGTNPFSGCSNLERIYVNDANQYYTSYNSTLFNSDKYENGINAIVEIKTNKIISGCKNTYIISSITSINNYAFSGLELDYIYIPSTITSFGYKSLSLIDHIYLESITNNVPFDAYGSSDTIIKTNVYSVGITKDNGCSDNLLYSVYKVNNTYEVSIDGIIDYDPQSMTSLSIANAFVSKYSNLEVLDENVTLSGYIFEKDGITCNVTAIGENAFKNCTSFLEISLCKKIYKNFIDNSRYDSYLHLKTIGTNAFSGCSKITKILMPKSIKTIEDGAFNNCSSLETVNFYGTDSKDDLDFTISSNNEYFINATYNYVKDEYILND